LDPAGSRRNAGRANWVGRADLKDDECSRRLKLQHPKNRYIPQVPYPQKVFPAMPRTTTSQAMLIGVLAALASFCGLKAFGGQPYSIVAQSTKETAATGRRPLAQRITAANLPVVVPARQPTVSEACPSSACNAAAEIVADPVSETPAVEETASNASETAILAADPTGEPPADEPLPPVVDGLPATMPEPAEGPAAAAALLARVKAVLAAKQQAQGSEELAETEAQDLAQMETQEPIQSEAQTEPVLPPAIPGTPPEPVAAAPVATLPVAPAALAAADAPARLEFDIHESRSLVREGEQIVVRMAVRNIGGEAAEKVNATLYFAEGMEPVEAIGHTAQLLPGEVRFQQVPSIEPGAAVDLLVTAIGTRAGSVMFRGELECSQIAGRIAREGAVTVSPREGTGE